MPQGINNDLADITLYTAITPVEFNSSNVPLSELDANIVLLDQKLEGWVQSGEYAEGQAGDGTFTTPVVLSPAMNTVPTVSALLDSVAGTGPETLFLSVSNRTINGFDLTVTGSGTAGAWTANVMWVADGR